MRVKTRSGFYTTIQNGSVVRQEKHVSKHETYYVLYLDCGKQWATAEPVAGVAITLVDKRRPQVEVAPATASFQTAPKRMSASDCPSAGGAFTAAKAVDKHAGDKVKGETFFTHKTSPGLVIKSPQGNVIHETKMSDMYKRRD